MTKKNSALPKTVDASFDFIPFALQSAGIGTWEHNLVGQFVHVDRRCQELYGLSGYDQVPYEQLLACIHPDDRLGVERARKWALDTRSGGQYDSRFRTIGADTGQLRWIRSQGRAYFDQTGKANRIVGVVQDTTLDQPTRNERADPDRLDQLTAVLSELGIFRLNLISDELVHTAGFARVVIGDANASVHRTDLYRHLHPQDELLRQVALEEATRTGLFLYEPRFIWSDGTIHQSKITGTMHLDDLGRPLFIVGLIEEITQPTSNLSSIEISFQTLVSASPVAMGLFQGQELIVETANEAMYHLLNGGREIIGKPLLMALPQWQDQPFAVLLQQAYTTGQPVVLSRQLISSWQDGQLINRHCTFYCTPLLDAQRMTYAVLTTVLDISDQVGAQRRLEVSETRFQHLFEYAPMAICMLKGRAMLFDMGNAKALATLGNINPLPGVPIGEILPEMKEQGFLQLLENVFDTGKPFIADGAKFALRQKNKVEGRYLDLVYTPLRDTSGAVTGVMIMTSNVTERVLAQQALEASNAKLRAVLDAAPTTIVLVVGKELIIEMANQAFIDIVGGKTSVIGKPLRVVVPEPESQSMLKQIEMVYTSGKPVESFGQQLAVRQHGVMTHNYYSITYSPLQDEVLCIGVDVTKEVKSRQSLEENE